MKTDGHFFYCYDEELMKELKRSGHDWICRGYHFKTKNKFWQFERNDSVNNCITQFKQNHKLLQKCTY